MTTNHFNKLIYVLLLLTLFSSSCNRQKNAFLPQASAVEATVPLARQSTPITVQGANQADNVHCGLQDKAGNLWFGTTGEGIYRYDGKAFTNFSEKDGLSSNAVWAILEDRAGNIWAGTNAGLCRYDPSAALRTGSETFTSIPISVTKGSNSSHENSPTNPARGNAVWSILQDKGGKLWFGTNDGVYCYNGASFTRFLDNESIINKSGLHLRRVESLLEDKKGHIWFASWDNEGVCLFDGNSLTNFKPNGDAAFKRILEDTSGNIWLASRPNRLYRYDGKTFTNVTEKEGLSGVTSILEDKAGNIWFGGDEDGGLWRFDGKAFTKFSTKDGLSHYGVWCVVEDRAGNIWVGTRNTGLYRYDGKSFTDFSGMASRR